MDVSGRAAVITGGGTGIGAATAIALAGEGCHVAVNYARSADAAADVADRCRSLGVDAVAVQGDVSSDDDCRRVVATAVEAFGRLDVLVNNAGTTAFVQHDDLDGIDADDFQRLFSVNTIGPFQMMRAAAPHLRADGGGEVVNVSSVAGVAAIGSSLPYCASKAALNNLTVAMSRVLAPEVRVNAVAPGFVTGRWWIEGQGQEAHDFVRDVVVDTVPLQAVCSPEDVATLIADVITGSDLMTAQVIVIDGGMLVKI